MLSNQVIQTSIEELKAITKIDLEVYDLNGTTVAFTQEEESLQPEIVKAFVDSEADSQRVGDFQLFKIQNEGEVAYVLAATGEEDKASMVARIAVSQLQALITAYQEKQDKNNFFQNLILDNLLLVDIHNRAKRLRIDTEARRLVYVIETKTDGDSGVIELLRGLFSPQSGDYVTSVDERSVVLIKTLKAKEGEEEIHYTAQVILDMLSSELMLTARVAYGNVVWSLRELSKSYKEAKLALDVGKIFSSEKKISAYSKLGIGRLIYQLPISLCRMFMEEIFGENLPEQLDEETLVTIYKFFENSLNVSETARQLFVHRNTLVYRIEKLQKATGLDIRNFDDALTFKIALMVVSYMKYLDSQQ